MSNSLLLVNRTVKEQVFYILPCRLVWQPRHTSILGHTFYCISERRPLLTEEFYLSVGREPRFQSRKPGELIYPVEDYNPSTRKSLLQESFSYWLWFRLRNIWNMSFHTIRGVFEKYWGTKPVLYPIKPSYIYPFNEWEHTSRTYYINCFGERRYLGHIRKIE
ncbi:hypothetical protein Gasu2_55720 [Galdieria sulphuraria]|nr:hypothetical protein Gasu2_55720 [Galdieria sulphuraria]